MAGKEKLITGALGALGDLVDEKLLSRRDVLKGAAATAITGALPTGARIASEIAQKSGVEDVLPVAAKTVAKLELPSLIDLPSYKQAIDDININQWDENVDIYSDDEAAEIITERLEDFDLSFDDVGIDPDNITYKDLLDTDFVEKTGIATDPSMSSTAFSYDDMGTLPDDAPNIVRWLNDEIPLDEIDESSTSMAGTVIRDLLENYSLTKRQIGEYLQIEGLDELLETAKESKIAGPRVLAGIEVPEDFIIDPKSWRLLDRAAADGQPYIEHRKTKERFELYDEDIANIEEHLKD